MTLPGTQVVFVDSGTPRSNPSDSGQAFVVQEAERGPKAANLVTSMTQLSRDYGSRQSYSYLYDVCETAFAEGAARVWVSRVIAATATKATLSLSDGTAATMTVSAKNEGDWGNGATGGLSVAVTTPTTGARQIVVYLNGAQIETSPPFTTKTDAYAWSQSTARYVTLADAAGTGLPANIAATNLTGGASNRGAITDADWQAALDRLTADLGPGQVCMPGQTTSTRQLMVIAHALARIRHAVLDAPDTANVATLTAAAAAVSSAPGLGGRWGSMYWPWLVIRGLTGGSTRTVPPSAAVLGLSARVDSAGNPNRPIAGERYYGGQLRYVDSLSQDPLVETDRETVNNAGINVYLRFAGGRPVQYGNRTLRDALADPEWSQASGSRLSMAIAARGGNILRKYVHDQIDGREVLQGHLAGELATMLADLYDRGALFGETPDEAYGVDTGAQVNPVDQIAAGLLKAQVQFKASPSADVSRLELVRHGPAEAIGV